MKVLMVIAAVLLGGVVSGPAVSASPVTGDQCVDCHEAESKTHAFHSDCASCHSGAEAHSQADRPRTTKVEMPESDQCLSCHSQDSRRMNFAFAEHNKAGVQCSNCHGVHSPKIAAPGAGMERFTQETALCATCHQDVMVRFNMRSHHAVKEGGVACNTCHDPHGGKQTSMMAKTAQCTQCHQAVRGPHAFEHAPVVEDCVTCHNPHGSPNRQLLELSQPMLCLQCHSVAGNRHGAAGSSSNNQVISGAALRNCSSCHNAVHGSHMDEHLRF